MDRRVTALPRRPGDETVCADAALKPDLESIQLSGTIPNERTLQFVLFLSRSQNAVLTARLAQLRASSRGAWLAEQGVAPGRCAYASSARVVSDHRPCPSQDGGCLQWLDVDGLKGGANAAWIGAR